MYTLNNLLPFSLRNLNLQRKITTHRNITEFIKIMILYILFLGVFVVASYCMNISRVCTI